MEKARIIWPIGHIGPRHLSHSSARRLTLLLLARRTRVELRFASSGLWLVAFCKHPEAKARANHRADSCLLQNLAATHGEAQDTALFGTGERRTFAAQTLRQPAMARVSHHYVET